jgi:hypothetical protein
VIRTIARLSSPWRLGIGVPLLLGLVLAFGVAVSWLTGREYEPPEELEAGPVADFQVAAPRLFEEDDIWVVRLPEEFLALYDRGVESGCPLQWRREFAFMDRAGWFVDACTGAAYDLTGRCFSDACLGLALSRFPVDVSGGNVVVGLRAPDREPVVDTKAEPLNPPAE